MRITPLLASIYLTPLWLPFIGLSCLATLVQHCPEVADLADHAA